MARKEKSKDNSNEGDPFPNIPSAEYEWNYSIYWSRKLNEEVGITN